VSVTEQQREQVREHYRRLAPHYGARANRTCERCYLRLARRSLGGRRRLLELGAGSSDLLDQLCSPCTVACDLSADMLGRRAASAATHRVVAAAERLPFAAGCFDGLFHVNMLEHVGDVAAVLAESARVLQAGGLCLAVTPNGNWERWLDLAERWKLKLPEGPHRFLTTQELGAAVRQHFEVLEQRTFLVLPAGPPALARLLDRLTLCAPLGGGFFQYVLARKPAAPGPSLPEHRCEA
jgi:ubiquinone/menaquinone biosynthesis C-methylase UbiE